MILDNFDWCWAKRILVCGGRDFASLYEGYVVLNNIEEARRLQKEYIFIHNTLYSLVSWSLDPYSDMKLLEQITIIQGGARGVDRAALAFAREYYPMNEETYFADWKTHGKAAGAIRNRQMLVEGKPDLVVAFPGNKGTADMIRRTIKAGVPLIKITPSTKTTLKPDYEFEFLCM